MFGSLKLTAEIFELKVLLVRGAVCLEGTGGEIIFSVSYFNSTCWRYSSKLMKTPLLFCFDFCCQIIREYIYIHKYLTVIFSTLRMLRGFLFWLQQFTFLLALRAFLFKPCLHFFFRAIQWLLAPLYTTFPRPLYFGIPFSFWNLSHLQIHSPSCLLGHLLINQDSTPFT